MRRRRAVCVVMKKMCLHLVDRLLQGSSCLRKCMRYMAANNNEQSDPHQLQIFIYACKECTSSSSVGGEHARVLVNDILLWFIEAHVGSKLTWNLFLKIFKYKIFSSTKFFFIIKSYDHLKILFWSFAVHLSYHNWIVSTSWL